jgi:hypothetical protein
MKKTHLLLFSCFLIPSSSLANEMPDIKAGLWEIETTLDGESEGKTLQCMDKNTTQEIMAASTKMLGDKCSDVSMKRKGAEYVSKLECDLGGSKMTSNSVMSGDFTTAFSVKADTDFSPPFMGQSKSTSTSTAKYLGKCKEGMEPGDAIMPDGSKVNLTKGMEGMPDLNELGAMQKALESGNMDELMQKMQNLQQMQQGAQ